MEEALESQRNCIITCTDKIKYYTHTCLNEIMTLEMTLLLQELEARFKICPRTRHEKTFKLLKGSKKPSRPHRLLPLPSAAFQE